MGRTLPSATQSFLIEEESFSRFRRALRRSDQLALDELFIAARQHLAAAAYAANALPMEVFLLAMLLEEHKEVRRLRTRIERSEAQFSAPPETDDENGEDG
jgi:non-homologous end joining protein Ku